MNAYILTLLSASLVAAIIELLTPKGEGGRIAAHVRMIAGLFLLVALLNPLKEGILFLHSAAEGDLVGRIEEHLPHYDVYDYESAFRDTLTTVGKVETEAWVISALEAIFGIPSEGCIVEAVCETQENTVALQEVRITLCGKYALEKPHPIEAYVTDQLKCPCYVTVNP